MRWFTPGWACFLAGIARISWQLAILAGSWDCSHRKNELIAARRWLRVAMLLCRSASSQFRNPVTASASMRSRVSLLGRDGPLVAEPGDQQLERVTVGRDRVR